MASKYADVVKKLERLKGEPDYEARVRKRREEILKEQDSWSSVQLALKYKELRIEKTELEEDISDTQLDIEAISGMLVDRFESEGMSKISLSGGGSVAVQPEPYATVKDKEAFRLWCIANGYERSLQLAWQTTNALSKERLLVGEPEPDGVVSFVKNKIVLRKV